MKYFKFQEDMHFSKLRMKRKRSVRKRKKNKKDQALNLAANSLTPTDLFKKNKK